MAKVLTKQEFEDASPRLKGWLVYMAGERADQPNVPGSWEAPDAESRSEYSMGQTEAYFEVLDGEE